MTGRFVKMQEKKEQVMAKYCAPRNYATAEP